MQRILHRILYILPFRNIIDCLNNLVWKFLCIMKCYLNTKQFIWFLVCQLLDKDQVNYNNCTAHEYPRR